MIENVKVESAETLSRFQKLTLEEMMDAVASVAAKARAAGKHAGIYVTDTAIAGRFVEMGYRLLATGSEQQLIAQGAAGLLSGLKQSIGAR